MGEEMKGKVGLDISAFQAAITKAKSMALQFGTAVGKVSKLSGFAGAAASAISIGAVTSGISSLLEKADGIDALAKRFDLTAEAVQAIQYAADQSGASADSMFVALKKINVAQQESLNGNKETAAAFAGLGVTMDDLRSKNFEQLFYQIGNRVNGASLESVKLGDAIKVFGKTGDQVIGAMRDGFADIAKGAREAGVVIQNEAVAKLAEANDKLNKLKAQAVTIAGNAAGPISTGISKAQNATDVAVLMRTQGGALQNWIDDLSGGLVTWTRILGALTVDPSDVRLNPVKPKGDQIGVNVEPEKKKELGRISIPSMNLTSNQQIGAYSSQDPFLNRQIAIEQAMLELQRKAAKDAAETAKNTAQTVKQLQKNSDYE